MNVNSTSLFVKTQDSKTADLLKNLNFEYLYQQGDTFIFLYDKKLFSEFSNKQKCYVTNSLVL